jgi:hypothetical protein
MTHEPMSGAEGASGPIAGESRGAAGDSESAAVETESLVDADTTAETELVEAEVVDGVPVLAEVRTLERAAPSSLPAVQAAAAAGAGFVAGAATIALVKRHAARKATRQGRGGSRRAADLLPIVATRSFLVDVHVIAKPGE